MLNADYFVNPDFAKYKQTQQLICATSNVAKEIEEIKTSYEKQIATAQETIDYERKQHISEKWFNRGVAIISLILTLITILIR